MTWFQLHSLVPALVKNKRPKLQGALGRKLRICFIWHDGLSNHAAINQPNSLPTKIIIIIKIKISREKIVKSVEGGICCWNFMTIVAWQERVEYMPSPRTKPTPVLAYHRRTSLIQDTREGKGKEKAKGKKQKERCWSEYKLPTSIFLFFLVLMYFYKIFFFPFSFRV